MCGIVGYIGKENAVPLILDGLKRLEYRGYDSAGVAVVQPGALSVQKAVGRLAALEDRLATRPLKGVPAIGHTRWATHGAPTEINAHPHTDNSGRIAVVHNGIIENYQELRERLEKEGCGFKSQTDTEVIPHLIASELKKGARSIEEALRRALQQSRGAYALGILSLDDPDTVYAARHGSPLIVGIGQHEYFIASDVPAILNRISQVIYLNDGEVAVLKRDGVRIVKLDGTEVKPDIKQVTLQAEAAERAGFETFMLKEIHEQPRVLRNLLEKHGVLDGRIEQAQVGLAADYFRKLNRIMIVACGTAYHAGMYGRLLLEHFTGLAVETDLASEFRYRDPKIDPGTLIIPVSQSGETADTLASIRMARAWGCKVLAVCNVAGSSVTRDSDAVFFTEAGPEIGVASTKAYTAQQMAFALTALFIARGPAAPWRGPGGGAVARPAGRAGRDPLRARPQGADQGHRGQAPRRAQLAVPRAQVQLPDRARGRAEEQGDFVPARGRLRRGRDEARPHRPHQRVPAGHLHLHEDARRGVREDDLQHEGGRGAQRTDHRAGHRGRHPCRVHRGRHHLRPARARRVLPDRQRRGAAAAGLLRRPGARNRHRQAEEPGEECDGGVKRRVTGDQCPVIGGERRTICTLGDSATWWSIRRPGIFRGISTT
jgi:glucosamine--fructose-6-phosphate aminotransferase (isomerizing)